VISFQRLSILDLDPEERSHLGIFLAFNIRLRFQELVMKIFYVSLIILSKKFYKPEVDPIEFLTIIYEKLELVNMSPLFLSRNVNEGFRVVKKTK
jgi:Fe-S cluster assembly ATP-binding protein